MLPEQYTGSDPNRDDEYVMILMLFRPGNQEDKKHVLIGEHAKNARESVGGVWSDNMRVHVRFFSGQKGPKVTILLVPW